MPVNTDSCSRNRALRYELSLALLCCLAIFASPPLPALAARPLLDHHQWDRYFALSARNVEVPWKPATVRLATYSGAPVDFTVYNIDPAEVIIAGQNRPARPINTTKRKALASWRFRPPSGYRFEVSDVEVPLGGQEGFYVVEARRGEAAQQVWLNRTHIGLITKESPGGLLVWCVDLHSGHALGGVHVAFLVGEDLVTELTDKRGVIAWTRRPRPSFALADQGAARAFVSLLPQAPLPTTIVGVRLEAAGVRAGERVRFIGFVRNRSDAQARYRPTSGDVHVMLAGHGKRPVTMTAHLDASGAFSGELPVPQSIDPGEYAVLAAAAGGVGGTSLHVDTGKSVSLSIRSNCPCSPAADVILTVGARRVQMPVAHLPIFVRVIRTPHIIPPGGSDDAVRWGTTVVYERTLHADENGKVRIDLPPPSDGLASTYGVRVGASGSTATSRIAVTTSAVALAVQPDAESIAVGEVAGFEIHGFDAADGRPAAGLLVTVRLVHGPVIWQRKLELDSRGHGHATFTTPALGTNLAFAQAEDFQGRAALDVTAISVDPSNRHSRTLHHDSDFQVSLDHARYRSGESAVVTAIVPGVSGDTLITLEGACTYQARIAKVNGGRATTSFKLASALGDVRVAVAGVRDGAVVLGFAPIVIDAPGHARETSLTLDRMTFAPGQRALVTIHDGALPHAATVAVRITDGRGSESAYLDDASDLLRIGGTTTQNPASFDPAWHAFVAPVGSKAADVYAAERPRTQPTEDFTLGAAAPRTLLWQIQRHEGSMLSVPLPNERGHYVLSLLEIFDEGDVGAASLSLNVQ